MTTEQVVSLFAQGVTPVTVLILLAVGIFRLRYEVEGLIHDKKTLQESNAELLNVYQRQVLPLLEKAVAAGEKSAEGVALLNQVARELGSTITDLKEVTRTERDVLRELDRTVIEIRHRGGLSGTD